jgi:2-dehydro-3-deoxyphosphogluconate aldolase/(4S)-4-hydroxy-2-oxoglutarate aldolase
VDVMQTLTIDRVAAVVRAQRVPDPVRLADTLAGAGIHLVEFTFTIPRVLEVIDTARASTATIGAGTVLTAEQAHSAIDAGAAFIVTPSVIPAVAAVCRDRRVPFMLGAYTPGEVLEARRLGSAAVKIFPASTCGPGHIKSLRGPFPNIALVPSGGVTLSTAAAFLDAGAVAVFAGSDLVSPAMVENEAYDEVLTRAAGYVAAVSS